MIRDFTNTMITEGDIVNVVFLSNGWKVRFKGVEVSNVQPDRISVFNHEDNNVYCITRRDYISCMPLRSREWSRRFPDRRNIV
jgi:hypothetical protein